MSISAEPSVLSPQSSSHAEEPVIRTFSEALQAFTQALRHYLEQPAATTWRTVLQSRRVLVAEVARSDRQDHARLEAVRKLVITVSQSGILDNPAEEQDLLLASHYARTSKGGPGLLAAMLLVPEWQWKEAPALDQVPDAWWGEFTRWVFTAPQGFTRVGQAAQYGVAQLARLEELTRWVERNSGSAVVKAALEAYASTATAIQLYFAEGSLKRHAELRGRLLTRAMGAHRDDFTPYAEPRNGRRLRVGIINRHFSPQSETFATLPNFEQLDPSRFEVHLYACYSKDSELERFCRSCATSFTVLPGKLDEQLDLLRSASLDVIIYGTNLTAVTHELVQLALYRIAPLQAVNVCSCITSGLPMIDLYISGELTEKPGSEANFTERLALMPTPAHTYNFTPEDPAATTAFTRAEFGLPEEATVFVTASNYFKLIPEMLQAWARLLAATPDSYLLVHPFNPNWSSQYPIKRFQADFVRILAEQGVAADRLVISQKHLPARKDVQMLLSLGDVYLDTFPFAGVTSLIDPCEIGLPLVTWEGDTFRSRMAGAFLRALKLDELIACDEASYLALAGRLATDVQYRLDTHVTLKAAMAANPLFLDSLAGSDTFGDVIETAFDEVAELGLEAFRATRTPLRTTGVAPLDAQSRALHARELLDEGRADRATMYFLKALQGDEANAALWFDVARALHANGQTSQALEALEACLRRDGEHIEGWIMMAELAHAVGAHDIAREAVTVVSGLAPTDDRILSISQRLNAA